MDVPVNTGTLVIHQTGAVGTVDLMGPSPDRITVAGKIKSSANVGTYTLSVTAPPGFMLESVRDASGKALSSPYTQKMGEGAGRVLYEVNYAPLTTSGTVKVTQTGALGTVSLAGLSPANINTETYFNAAAGTGTYTLSVIAPDGFVVESVEDAMGHPLTLSRLDTQAFGVGTEVYFAVFEVNCLYTQTLLKAGAIVFKVNYARNDGLEIKQPLEKGVVSILGPSPKNDRVLSIPVINGSSGAPVWSRPAMLPFGAYSIAIDAPRGFVVESVRDGSGKALASPYTQNVGDGAGPVLYEVNYAPLVSSGTIRVELDGANGNTTLVGPSAEHLGRNTSYYDDYAGAGTYTLDVTAPFGFEIESVKDDAGATLKSPYTQILTKGGTIVYKVTLAPHSFQTQKEWKAAIREKSALCMAIIDHDDIFKYHERQVCLRDRNQMKKAFSRWKSLQRQEAKQREYSQGL